MRSGANNASRVAKGRVSWQREFKGNFWHKLCTSCGEGLRSGTGDASGVLKGSVGVGSSSGGLGKVIA